MLGRSFVASTTLAFIAVLAGACSTSADDADSSGSDLSKKHGTDAGAASAACGVTRTGTSGLLLQGTVLAPSGPIVGEVLVDSAGKIACVDTSCASTSGYAAATILACSGGVISAGLINGHDHTEYNNAAPIPHGTTRWDHRNGWRAGTGNEPKIPNTPKSTSDTTAVAAAELRFVLGGATSVSGSGGVSGLLRNLATRTASQLEGLTGPAVFFDTFPLGDSNGTEIASGCNYPNIRKASAAFQNVASYSPHVAEGINPSAENEFACVNESSLVTNNTALIHGVGLDANDVSVIAKAGAKVIWAGRTNVDLYGNTAPVTLLKTMGVTIGLGTDWLASGSMNMLRELACVDSLNQKYFDTAFDDRALVEMATRNSAVALGVDGEVGTLTKGLFADITVFNATTDKGYRAVINAGVEDVLLVLRGGKPLYGDAAIVNALQTGCDALDVCGTQKGVCIDTPGTTLAKIQASTAAGSVVSALLLQDGDAEERAELHALPRYVSERHVRDGPRRRRHPDAEDDCPTVFNPARSMDGTAQADVDKDGTGDACDAAPLDATKQ